ncbi:MAG: serine/threonine protein kinase [Deltaproteobacteria bacterium]|nr:serine/threonine protein kinase [Deltaproteobacteria bacterium]
MIPEQVQSAIDTLTSTLASAPVCSDALFLRWRAGESNEALSAEACAAADVVDRAFPALSRSSVGTADLGALFGEPRGEIVFLWCEANAGRRDARLSKLLAAGATHRDLLDRVVSTCLVRIVEGPMLDALNCAPLMGRGDVLARPENASARARMEILIWEAGASALQVPELGAWLWGSHETFETLVGGPARGSLRGRVLAARCIEICARGMPATTDPERVGRTLQVLQPLLLHPEPLVWIHAARALGLLTGVVPQLEGMLLDWMRTESPLLRQRAMTAFASLPGDRLKFLGGELIAVLDAPDREPTALAAAAAATPYLFFERRELWDRIATRILAGEGGSVAARALARGLGTLWRRGSPPHAIEAPFRQLREIARRAQTRELDEWRRWLEVIAITDPIDGAERDPLDLELGLENLMRLAAQYDDEEADARAARFAEALAPTFQEARRIVLGAGTLRHRAAAFNAFEGCARSLALRLWGPQLTTRPTGDPVAEPNLEETWRTVARAPAEMLDIVKERRAAKSDEPQVELALEVMALRLGGYALDACGGELEVGPGRGPTAHDTCLWLRKLEGLADGSRELPAPLRNALSALFWRLVDTTRGAALGEVDDVRWLGPFAAWWALVIDRPALLLQLATALPMIDAGALETCCDLANTIRNAVASGAADGQWGKAVGEALAALHADDTELSSALLGLSHALGRFAGMAGTKPELEPSCVELVLAAERLRFALANPVKGLHPANAAVADDSLSRNMTENAPRIAGQIARAIRARELSMLEVWFSSLGPITSALVESSVRGAVRRTPPPPPAPKKEEPRVIEGYELIKPLGEGGIGTVWLVRKPGADRLFVLKIPKADALKSANEVERAGILASFVEEAKALAGLYHPNVANIIDRGVSNDVPFLVLEYLIGADLRHYSYARLMSLFELRSVVLESCAGLAALHSAGLVHRDIKPANLWLRLPLAGGEKFDGAKHRDPALAQPLSTVVIDFGMVRASRVPADACGRFVAGTPGYIAPEQVLDPVELDGRADVYALAGTIYNVTTGKSFFDDIESLRDRVLAHMQRDPMEDAERFRSYPAALVKLMREATAHNPKDRPQPMEFGRGFVATL